MPVYTHDIWDGYEVRFYHDHIDHQYVGYVKVLGDQELAIAGNTFDELVRDCDMAVYLFLSRYG